ncbi:CAP domain-containing protein [Streptomyces sp. NBC_00878]|uniref:CAP domain-containing protein n=1 Tax=Streptomyces sp. NBC_00878 TaxID=2975854 RepID=UPI002B1DFA1B|nr:CAP domain-containing protein [Streptomyces sp. NBC_00878]
MDDHATAGDGLTAGHYLNGSPYATAGMYDSPGGIHETGDLYSKSDTHLFAADPAAHASTGYAPDGGAGRGHRRRKKNVTPVRTGLLGVSAAVAMGAVAVASGLIPGADNYSIGGGDSDKVRAQNSPSDVQTQGGTDGTADDRADSGTSRDLERTVTPSVSPTKAPEKTEEKETPSAKPSTKAPVKEKPKTEPTTKAPEKKAPSTTPSKTGSTTSTAEAEVLSLVNEERAKAGCSPVTASNSLAALAEAFSEDMAARGFFDHTDPSGASPWDRAEKAGVTNLGGENIARGQADAAAVMEAWMNSPGHRANILNCDFKTLGVGAHFASGGPWWTQDFGY